ncbi:hypothetical protein K2173_021828 [Erythroxylum novogranatense]|uniref:Uncharacterized protein n=1 Tax=Erythroxylum novogranatense TaxID=1862640 RepID=A0AAV8T3F0_9ROSI|nr:hypothetical protein K2173_021828 [Erythroxylum novogranatense]
MGNCFAFSIPKIGSCVRVVSSHQKALQIVKADGKILEFSRPIMVKDILVEFSGLGIGLSKDGSEYLPPDSELKLGKVYYLLPCVKPVSAPVISYVAERDRQTNSVGGVRRIKVLITKQQLEMLMGKQASLDEILACALERRCSSILHCSTSWKPMLESIPEAGE